MEVVVGGEDVGGWGKLPKLDWVYGGERVEC